MSTESVHLAIFLKVALLHWPFLAISHQMDFDTTKQLCHPGTLRGLAGHDERLRILVDGCLQILFLKISQDLLDVVSKSWMLPPTFHDSGPN